MDKIGKIINGFKKDNIFWNVAEMNERDILYLSLPPLSQEEKENLIKRIKSEKQRLLEGGK